MADAPSTYSQLKADQISKYSTLSGAMVPTRKPFYILPQEEYQPAPPNSFLLGSQFNTMPPIYFDDPNFGSHGVPLNALMGHGPSVPLSVKNGSDLVFANCPDKFTINLRIMASLTSLSMRMLAC